jgi:hypothetical protein
MKKYTPIELLKLTLGYDLRGIMNKSMELNFEHHKIIENEVIAMAFDAGKKEGIDNGQKTGVQYYNEQYRNS